MPILIVEDDSRVADFLNRGLRAEGYVVHLAKSGTEGLAMARRGDHEVILLDVMLPGLNGIELCQTVRSEGCNTPILMLSAMNTVDDRVAGLRCGADDYLVKPFAFEELLARIEALRRRGNKSEEADSTLTVDDLVFDREKMRVSRAAQAVSLTAKEMALLELLMRHPGRLYSRERILAIVWGVHEDPLTNVVDVYVRRLRAKLDDGHAVQLIKTLRGLGYKIESQGEQATS